MLRTGSKHQLYVIGIEFAKKIIEQNTDLPCSVCLEKSNDENLESEKKRFILATRKVFCRIFFPGRYSYLKRKIVEMWADVGISENEVSFDLLLKIRENRVFDAVSIDLRDIVKIQNIFFFEKM